MSWSWVKRNSDFDFTSKGKSINNDVHLPNLAFSS